MCFRFIWDGGIVEGRPWAYVVIVAKKLSTTYVSSWSDIFLRIRLRHHWRSTHTPSPTPTQDAVSATLLCIPVCLKKELRLNPLVWSKVDFNNLQASLMTLRIVIQNSLASRPSTPSVLARDSCWKRGDGGCSANCTRRWPALADLGHMVVSVFPHILTITTQRACNGMFCN